MIFSLQKILYDSQIYYQNEYNNNYKKNRNLNFCKNFKEKQNYALIAKSTE